MNLPRSHRDQENLWGCSINILPHFFCYEISNPVEMYLQNRCLHLNSCRSEISHIRVRLKIIICKFSFLSAPIKTSSKVGRYSKYGSGMLPHSNGLAPDRRTLLCQS